MHSPEVVGNQGVQSAVIVKEHMCRRKQNAIVSGYETDPFSAIYPYDAEVLVVLRIVVFNGLRPLNS